MKSSPTMPDQYDRDFWRARAKIKKLANGRTIRNAALETIPIAHANAERHTRQTQYSAAAGELRRSELLALVADFEAADPHFRSSILRLRADNLRSLGQKDPAAEFNDEADRVLVDYYVNLTNSHRASRSATQVIAFARASLQENPRSPHAPKLRRILVQAEKLAHGYKQGFRLPQRKGASRNA